jgi:hypothetical protein
MPRPKLARRFEPRYGVSQSMLEVESRYIARELEDYLLLSADELRQKLKERQDLLASAEEDLQGLLGPLPDRHRLALRCMLARDLLHIAALYQTFQRSGEREAPAGASAPAPEELTEQDEPRPVLPFSEWLFEA